MHQFSAPKSGPGSAAKPKSMSKTNLSAELDLSAQAPRRGKSQSHDLARYCTAQPSPSDRKRPLSRTRENVRSLVSARQQSFREEINRLRSGSAELLMSIVKAKEAGSEKGKEEEKGARDEEAEQKAELHEFIVRFVTRKGRNPSIW